jgi:hypothetical protein
MFAEFHKPLPSDESAVNTNLFCIMKTSYRQLERQTNCKHSTQSVTEIYCILCIYCIYTINIYKARVRELKKNTNTSHMNTYEPDF